MGTDDTDGHGQSLEPGATDARLRGGFVPQKTALVFAGGGSWERFRSACCVS